ncbi:hypothetical protein SOI901_24 [Erwinia phage SOI901]
MYHSILSNITKSVDDQFLTHLTFRTQDVKEISIQRDGAGELVKGWLTLDTVCEGENYVVAFTREHHATQLELLAVLNQALEAVKPYFEDEQGNIFPFDKIMYVNAAKTGFVMAAGIDIALHPTKEWPQFANDYRNWLDLCK